MYFWNDSETVYQILDQWSDLPIMCKEFQVERESYKWDLISSLWLQSKLFDEYVDVGIIFLILQDYQKANRLKESHLDLKPCQPSKDHTASLWVECYLTESKQL